MGFNLPDIMGGIGNIGSSVMNMFGGGVNNIGGGRSTYGPNNVPQGFPQGSAGGSGGGNFLNEIFKGMNIPQMAMGAGINAVGNMTAPKINTPNLTQLPSYQKLNNFNYSLPPDVEASIQRQHAQIADKRKRELQGYYANLRPGTDYLTDSKYMSDDMLLNQELEKNLQDALSSQRLSFGQAEQGRLQNNFNAEQSNAMIPYGAEVTNADNYRKGFSDIGSMFMQSGMPKNEMMQLFKLMKGQ